jgi:hypothetical protein
LHLRAFLKGAAASATIAALPGLSCVAASAAPVVDLDRFPVGPDALPLRGVWWFYPSFLEYPEGPWGRRKEQAESPTVLWKSCLSWMADHGLNAAFVHLGPFGRDRSPWGRDRVRTGWGFHYVIDHERFPEAATFDRGKVARHRHMLNEICSHGRSVGVDVYTHHYNFSATKPFVDPHRDELLRLPVGTRGEMTTLEPDTCDQKRILYRHMCWNAPLFQEYMRACWEELLDAVPDLAGILVTPGENARCPCVRCVGFTDDPLAGYGDSDERIATLGDFAGRFAEIVRGKGRQPLVRAWAAGVGPRWREGFPKTVPYVMKYSFFDVVDAGPDPALADWIAHGHTVLASPEITGGENAGPTFWRRPEYLAEVVARTRAAGATGLVACVNSEHGYIEQHHPVQWAPLVQFGHAAAAGGGDPRAVALAWDRKVFGEAGEAVHDALEDCAQITFGLPRVVFQPTEGFTWHFPYHFGSGAWPGVLGNSVSSEPWVARDLASLSDLYDLAGTRGWMPDPGPAQLDGKKNPITFLEQTGEAARRGEATILALADRVPREAAEDYELVRISARLSVLLADEWIAMLRAKQLFRAAMGPNPPELQRRLARDCLAAFDRSVAALDETYAVGQTIPERLLDETVRRLPRKIDQRAEERGQLARAVASLGT